VSKQDNSRSLHAKSDALGPSAIGTSRRFVVLKNIASRMTSAAHCVAIQDASQRPTDKAQFLSTGWNPVAFKTAAPAEDDMKLMNALAASGALLAVAIPAAITVVF
jgi:hypothetical protein